MKNLVLDKSVKFSDDILSFCYEGFIHLYKSKDNSHTIAVPSYKMKEKKFVWVFDLDGNFEGDKNNLDLNNYTRLKLDIDSQVQELFRLASQK